jgi:hypothetical protein
MGMLNNIVNCVWGFLLPTIGKAQLPYILLWPFTSLLKPDGTELGATATCKIISYSSLPQTTGLGGKKNSDATWWNPVAIYGNDWAADIITLRARAETLAKRI